MACASCCRFAAPQCIDAAQPLAERLVQHYGGFETRRNESQVRVARSYWISSEPKKSTRFCSRCSGVGNSENSIGSVGLVGAGRGGIMMTPSSPGSANAIGATRPNTVNRRIVATALVHSILEILIWSKPPHENLIRPAGCFPASAQ